VEQLIAALLMSVAVAGVITMFVYTDRLINNTRATHAATQLARQEMEIAKAWGYDNLPLGTYSAGTNSATWSGSYDPTLNSGAGGWSSGNSAFFDINGTRVASGSASQAYQLTTTITDTSVEPPDPNSGNAVAYALGFLALRKVGVSVVQLSTGSTIISMGTYIVKGGI